jgi:hypothetical protein
VHLAEKAITSDIDYTSGDDEELDLYSASPRALRATTRAYKALPSIPPRKRVRLNSGKPLESEHDFVSAPLAPLSTLVTVPARTPARTPGRTRTPARTPGKSPAGASATNRRAPADYSQGDARDVSCLGCIKSALASQSDGVCYNVARSRASSRCVRCSKGH